MNPLTSMVYCEDSSSSLLFEGLIGFVLERWESPRFGARMSWFVYFHRAIVDARAATRVRAGCGNPDTVTKETS